MNKTYIENLLQKNQFLKFEWVESRLSIADLYKPDRRCGIYVLRFKDEQYYVGQAIDVTRRYVQHKKNHNDIQEIAFKVVRKEKLDEEEHLTVKILESAGAKLRNILLTSYPTGEFDLDLVISKQEQETFIKTIDEHEFQPPVIDYPDLQKKYTRKFKKLIQHKDFKTSVDPFLRLYLKKCIIQPERTELTFWSLTCLTKAFLDSDLVALCRINLFKNEVLTIWIDYNGDIVYSFHLTKLSKTDIKSLKYSPLHHILVRHPLNSNYKDKIRSFTHNKHYYISGGADQFQIEVRGISDALKLLSNDKIVTAIRTFNLRQMQKGPSIYSRYHCLDLTRYFFKKE